MVIQVSNPLLHVACRRHSFRNSIISDPPRNILSFVKISQEYKQICKRLSRVFQEKIVRPDMFHLPVGRIIVGCCPSVAFY